MRGVVRNCYWSFEIEHKVFILHLFEDGGHVKVSERTRLASFGLELEVVAAVWCLEILQGLIASANVKLFRKFHGANYVLLLEEYENRRGKFVKITKLARGKLWNTIIPGGKDG